MFVHFVVLAIFLMPVTLQFVKMRSFLATPSCDDKISNIEFVAEHQARSDISCAAMCDVNCGCFGFNSQMKKCRIHRSCDLVNMTSTEGGWRYYPFDPPPDCKAVLESGESTSGLYVIDPFGDRQRMVTVYCDMETDSGGWAAIQRRLSGTMNFDKTWMEFKNGFGVPQNAYWIGDSMINAGYYSANLNGMAFSTMDQDNDQYSGHCATKYGGGWWFNNCHDAFLNGPWPPEYWHDPWRPTISSVSNIAEIRLMIKPT